MNAITKIASLALATLIVGTGLVQAGGNRVQLDASKVPLLVVKSVGCIVQGTPSEFPNDLLITNKSGSKLVAGTRINWSVSSYGMSGASTLVADLNAGQSVYLSNVLPGGAEAGRACKATAQ